MFVKVVKKVVSNRGCGGRRYGVNEGGRIGDFE